MLTKHHIIPRSRGGNSGADNIIRVDEKKHQAYHLLFANKLQHEIIEYLIDEWFNGEITPATQELFLALLARELEKKGRARKKRKNKGGVRWK